MSYYQTFLYTRLYYAEACKEFAGPISATLRQGHTAAYAEMLHRWQHGADLADPGVEPRSPIPEAVTLTVTPTGWSLFL